MIRVVPQKVIKSLFSPGAWRWDNYGALTEVIVVQKHPSSPVFSY